MLVVVSGLPGVGKTTISRELARATGAVYVRIDSIEQPLRTAGWHIEGEGYMTAHEEAIRSRRERFVQALTAVGRVASLMPASWNRIAAWLDQIDGLRRAA